MNPLAHSARPAEAQSSGPDSSASTASDARSAANRANAQHSTGPRTPEGKARSSPNALKHGVFSATLAWAGEPLNELGAERDTVLSGLLERYAPEGIEEEMIVDEMAMLWWKLVRINANTQWRLRNRVQSGADLLDSLKESESLGVQEGRLQRALSRQRKDLFFLQRYRQGETRAWRRDAGAARKAQMAELRAETEAEMQAYEAKLQRARAEDEADEARLRAARIDPAAASEDAATPVDDPEADREPIAAEDAPLPSSPAEETGRRSAA
jgi:hypothetical protein